MDEKKYPYFLISSACILYRIDNLIYLWTRQDHQIQSLPTQADTEEEISEEDWT